MADKRSGSTSEATVVHISEGADHVVGIGSLRVSILEDGGYWYAQGLEIDYLAEGTTAEDAKQKFVQGLTFTIHANLQIYGSIAPLLNPAPTKIWKEFLSPNVLKKKYTHVSVHQIEALQNYLADLPFQKIEYLEAT